MPILQDAMSTPLDAPLGVLRLSAKWETGLMTAMRLKTVEDLLLYYPFRYNDRSRITPYRYIHGEQPVLLVATLRYISYQGEGVKRRLEVEFQDETGIFLAVFFKGLRFIQKQLILNARYQLFGKPSRFQNTYSFVHPELEILPEGRLPRLGLEPVYEIPEVLKKIYFSYKRMAEVINKALLYVDGQVTEVLPPEVRSRYNLMSRAEAIWRIHFPRNEDEARRAREYFKCEEWLLLQMQQAEFLVRDTQIAGIPCTHVGELFNGFYHNYLRFALTGAQKRVVHEIFDDMRSGRQMNRLLQGDVGSGKTLVALFALLLAVDNQAQGCLMAPTEILATQHYKGITKMLGDLPVRVELLTGSTSQRDRKRIAKTLEEGSLHILIGTHALIEDTVVFHNLGLVIVDEQHRFGVGQRAKLWGKNPTLMPHILVMSATPIPRTLALTLFAGLDVSVIDELPAGRKPITTQHYFNTQRAKLYEALRAEIAAGHQAYIVYPLVNESEKFEYQSVVEGFEKLQVQFPEYSFQMLHGQLPPQEKEQAMQAFAAGKVNILVATTVIEVGVDVPNATIMIIEDADRFGLTQLHQLRGRVGRGGNRSYCYIVTRPDLKEHTLRRLRIFTSTNDGFKIAEEDLRLRGAGDLQGERQSGYQGLMNIVEPSADATLVEWMRETVRDIYTKDPTLNAPEHAGLRAFLEKHKVSVKFSTVRVG